MRGRGFGGSGEIGVASRNYLLTSRKGSGSFWSIRSYTYSLTISAMSRLVAPEPPSQIADIET